MLFTFILGGLGGAAAMLGLFMWHLRRNQVLTAQQAASTQEQAAALQSLRQEQDQMQEIVLGAAVRVQEEQERTQTILSALGEGLFGLDTHGCLLFLNPAGERLLGWTETELLGTPIHELIHPQQSRETACSLETCPLLNSLQFGRSHRAESDHFTCKDGALLAVDYFCTPLLRAGKLVGALVTFDDIADRIAAARALDEYARHIEAQHAQLQEYCQELQATQAQLEKQARELTEMNAQMMITNTRLEALAVTDGMTELANHCAFQETLRAAWPPDRRIENSPLLSLVLLDVDHFKQYNDTYGHPAGDEVLRIVARLLRENVREGDLVARYGGEEFVIIAWQADTNVALGLAERLRLLIAGYAFPHRQITVSAGVATHDARQPLREEQVCYETPDDLISAADAALYAGKRTGGNCTCLSPGLEAGQAPRAQTDWPESRAA